MLLDDPNHSGMPGMSHSSAILPQPQLRLYTPRPAARRDWTEIRGRINLVRVTAELLGAPIERRGLQTATLAWHCPFHKGRVPSFQVVVGEKSWSCSVCGAGGDAAALIMRVKAMAFRDAIAWLDEHEDFVAANSVCNVRRGFRRVRSSR